EFAHQRLVVHCDLKHANVIVTPEGCARLLDFGIAKLLNPAHYGFGDPLTRTFRPLTPEFASPEQLSGQPLTTATDLYSVGVLLYGLVAGEHPFEDVIMQPVSLLEAICFEPPEPPSRRAARRPGGPVNARRIEGDLDAIVLKALRKEPEQRYPSAALFAADLRRFLEGMPVEARQGSWRYRAAKFARRNRGAAAAIAMAILAVGIGAAGTLWEGVRAERARTRAERRFNEVRRLSNTLLADFYDNVGKLPGATGVQQMLVVRSVRYLDSLAAESQSNPSLALELADGYVKLAGLQGSPYENNIGKPDEGLATIAKAVTTSSRLANDIARDHQAFLVLSKARQMRGDVLLGIGRIQEALEESRLAADIMDRLATQRPTDAGILVQAASCHEAVGDQLGSAGLTSMLDRGAAKREFEHALDLYRRANRADGALPRPRRALVVIGMKLADVGWDMDPAASLAGYQEAYRALQQLPPRELEALPNRRLRASLLRRLGESFSEFGRHDDALKILEEDVQVLDSMLSIDPANERAQWDLTIAVNAQGNAESARGRPRAALPYYERVLALLQKMPNLERSVQLELSHGETLAAIGGILNSTGDATGA
ncbi:MAG: protein kinase, partial [Candidatus Solibacter sp.]|nr:protein kinase [Candidatus Solibacter sp.]